MEVEKEHFKKMFPNLAKELEGREPTISVTSIRSNLQVGEGASTERVSSCMPDVIDFLRRCDNNQQAEEIINYLEKRGEVDSRYARKLRSQLKARGVRSFGSRKEEDYYSKQGDL